VKMNASFSYIEQIDTQFDWFQNAVFGNHECKDLDVALHHKLIIFCILSTILHRERMINHYNITYGPNTEGS